MIPYEFKENNRVPHYFDDNVFDPISRKGQESVYDQFFELYLSLKACPYDEIIPYFSIVSFFERIGKGSLWKEIDIYENINISQLNFEDREKLAFQVGKIAENLLANIKKSNFFSKENLAKLYEEARTNFVGNQKASELLNYTFYRLGNAICRPLNDHFNLIAYELWWDRLVTFPLLWVDPSNVPEKDAKSTWMKIEKFYDILFALYHNRNLIATEAPFTRLLLHRRFINHLLDFKHLKHEIKKTSHLNKILILYKIRRLEKWVKKHPWVFKFKSDLGDVKLSHFAIYGFLSDDNQRRPGICVTCDPVNVVEQRLFLCKASNQELNRQVEGWNLQICPGKIICLNYADYKFTHVKTIDVRKYFDQRSNIKSNFYDLRYKLDLFLGAIKDIARLW